MSTSSSTSSSSLADKEWSLLQASLSTPSNIATSQRALVSSILKTSNTSSSIIPPTARAWRPPATSSLDALLGGGGSVFTPNTATSSSSAAPTATASNITTRQAAATRVSLTIPLPLLATFTTSAAATSSYARDIAGLSDESLEVRAESISRLCTAICGCSWAAPRRADESTIDFFSLPEELSSTSHTTREVSAAHGFRGTVPSAPLAMDIAFGFSARDVSEVAALLLGRSSNAGAAIGPVDSLEAMGGAAAGCEVGATTRSLALALARQHPDICFDGPMSGSPQRVAQSPDSDDEEGELGADLRRRALEAEEAAKALAATAPTTKSVNRSVRADLFAEFWMTALVKPVLKRLDDPCEAVRICALRLTATAVASLRDTTGTLQLLLPLLLSRFNSVDWTFDEQQKIFARGGEALDALRRGRVLPGFASAQSTLASPTVRAETEGEPSEAARVSCVALLAALLRGAAAHGGLAAVSAWAHHIIVAAHALCADTAPPVRAAAAVLILQVTALLPQVVKHFAVALARGALPGMRARAAILRIAAIDVFDALIHCADDAKGKGAGTEAFLLLLGARDAHSIPIASFYETETTTNYAAMLTLDTNAAVRSRWTAALGGWVTRLPDRHEWWPHLMPYLLSCLTDEGAGSDDAAALPPARAALLYIEACGAAHEIEHAKLLLERVQYGIDGVGDAEIDAPLPVPFVARPRLGSRLFIRTQGRRVLPPLLRELREWDSFGGAYAGNRVGARVRAAALLSVLLVFYEEAATQDSAELAGALAASLESEIIGTTIDHDSVAPHLRSASRIAGRFLAPSAWLSMLGSISRGSPGASRSKGQGGAPSRAEQAGALTATALALGELARRPARVDIETILALADVLTDADTWAATQPVSDGLVVRGSGVVAATALDAATGNSTKDERPVMATSSMSGAALVDVASSALARLRQSATADATAAIAATIYARARRALISCAFHSARITRARAGAATAVGPKLLLIALAVRGAVLCDVWNGDCESGTLPDTSLRAVILDGVWPGTPPRKEVSAPCGFANGVVPPLALADATLVAVASAMRGDDATSPRATTREAADISATTVAALVLRSPTLARGTTGVTHSFEHAVLVGAASLVGCNDTLCDAIGSLVRSAPIGCASLAPFAIRIVLPLAKTLTTQIVPRVRVAALCRALTSGARAARRLGAIRASDTVWQTAFTLLESTHVDISASTCSLLEVEDFCTIVDDAASTTTDAFSITTPSPLALYKDKFIFTQVATRAALFVYNQAKDDAICARLVQALVKIARACGIVPGGISLDSAVINTTNNNDEGGDGVNDQENMNALPMGEQAIAYNNVVGAAMIIAAHAPTSCAAMIMGEDKESGAAKAILEHCQLMAMFASRRVGGST